MQINLEKNEWIQVLALLGKYPFEQVSVLIMKMGSQIREQDHDEFKVPSSTGVQELDKTNSKSKKVPPNP